MTGLLFDDMYSDKLAMPPAPVKALEGETRKVIGATSDQEKRTDTQAERILAMLQQGSVTNFELADICIRYSARIHELRKEGHVIETVMENKKTGLVVYRYGGKR